MFRRRQDSAAHESLRPVLLRDIGYFVNESDQIRMIKYPDRKYQFKVDRKDYVNEFYLAVFQGVLRKIIYERLIARGLSIIRLPFGATSTDRHLPIYKSPDIESKKRIIVIFGSRDVEPGICSLRIVADEGISKGTILPLFDALFGSEGGDLTEHTPGLIIANPCQLHWNRREGRAVGDREWLGLPRPSINSEPYGRLASANMIPMNRTFTEHVWTMFTQILGRDSLAGAKFDIIAMEFTGKAVMEYLAANWNQWKSRINGICLGNPQHTPQELYTLSNADASFGKFVRERVRGYLISDMPLDTVVPLEGRYDFNCYSSGERYYEDGILPNAWRSMLNWFNMIETMPNYAEPIYGLIEVQGAGR